MITHANALSSSKCTASKKEHWHCAAPCVLMQKALRAITTVQTRRWLAVARMPFSRCSSCSSAAVEPLQSCVCTPKSLRLAHRRAFAQAAQVQAKRGAERHAACGVCVSNAARPAASASSVGRDDSQPRKREHQTAYEERVRSGRAAKVCGRGWLRVVRIAGFSSFVMVFAFFLAPQQWGAAPFTLA